MTAASIGARDDRSDERAGQPAPAPLEEIVAAFADAAGLDSAAHAAIAEPVAAALARARAAHPDVVVDERALAVFVGERVARAPASDVGSDVASDVASDVSLGDAVVAELAAINLADVMLACGCSHGCNVASARFLALARPALAGVVRGMRLDMAQLDELQSTVFTKLFIGEHEGARPKIGHYRGEGELRAWVKVVGVRLLLNTLRRQGRQHLEADRLLDRAMDRADEPADLTYMKAMYRREFRESFAHAVAALSPKQRNLLRYQLLDGMGPGELSRIYRVHRATIHRWLAEIQQALLSHTRERMQRQLDVDGEELDSIVRMIQSSWHITVSRLLRAA